MSSFQGQRVSASWRIVLLAAAHDKVPFKVNDGRRTMAEQEDQVRRKGLWSPSNPHGAARPNPDAPHIRVGREAHALDVDSWANGENLLQAWLTRHGARATNTVPGEPWHLEVSEADLLMLAKRFKAPPKRERLTEELARIRHVVRTLGRWTPARERRADAIKRWLKGHR
jgi:hypothetical protein